MDERNWITLQAGEIKSIRTIKGKKRKCKDTEMRVDIIAESNRKLCGENKEKMVWTGKKTLKRMVT